MIEILKNIISPIAELIDDVHTSDEEKLQLRNELARIEAMVGLELLNFEKEKLEAQRFIVIAEAKGESWSQRNWRPITMLTFLVMILINSFGFFPVPLSDEIWLLLQIGLGGYVVGRSGEKIAKGLGQNAKMQ